MLVASMILLEDHQDKKKLARHSEKPSATILTPVGKHLRRFVEENEGKSVSQSRN